MRSTTILSASLGWAPLFLSLLSLVPANAAGPGGKGGKVGGPSLVRLNECETRIQKVLYYFPLDRLKGRGALEYPAGRIREDTVLVDKIAKDYHLVVADFDAHVARLPREVQPQCAALKAGLTAQLESYFSRRLLRLARAGDAQGFYDEYQTLLSYWMERQERRRISESLRDAELAYLSLGLATLRRELVGTRWEGFNAIAPRLESWSDEWARFLGGDIGRGVQLSTGRIAIRSGELDPTGLKILLFHELAHLADLRLRTPSGREGLTELDSELGAWAETFDYMDFLANAGRPLPEELSKARALARSHGLRNWVESVLGARALGVARAPRKK